MRDCDWLEYRAARCSQKKLRKGRISFFSCEVEAKSSETDFDSGSREKIACDKVFN